MASGAGIEPGVKLACHLTDFAPTVLGRLGLATQSQGMEGADVFGSSGANVRKDNGHSSMHTPHVSEQKAGFEYDDEEQRLIEQRLADLGYLE